MHLHPGYRVKDDEAAPFGVNTFAFGQESKGGLDNLSAGFSLRAGQAKAVLGGWPRAHVPELDQVLRRVTNPPLRAPQGYLRRYERSGIQDRMAPQAAEGY